jgi:hypothetical protein
MRYYNSIWAIILFIILMPVCLPCGRTFSAGPGMSRHRTKCPALRAQHSAAVSQAQAVVAAEAQEAQRLASETQDEPMTVVIFIFIHGKRIVLI